MNDVIEQNTPQDDNNRNYMMIIYGLYALSLVTAGCAALIGVILACITLVFEYIFLKRKHAQQQRENQVIN